MSKSGVEKFAAGVVVGAVAGVLLAPKSGKETREDLKVAFNELLEKAKNIKAEDVKATIEKKVAEIKAGLADLDKEKALEIAKEKGAQLKDKAQDLYNLAVEKGTPVLKKTANDILDSVIKVSKETQKKLAKEEK